MAVARMLSRRAPRTNGRREVEGGRMRIRGIIVLLLLLLRLILRLLMLAAQNRLLELLQG